MPPSGAAGSYRASILIILYSFRNRDSIYLDLHDEFVNILLDGLRLDGDLRRLLDDVGPPEPRDIRLRIRLALALHRDQGTGFVRNDARFLDERRRETRSLFCILERSTVRQGSPPTSGSVHPEVVSSDRDFRPSEFRESRSDEQGVNKSQ